MIKKLIKAALIAAFLSSFAAVINAKDGKLIGKVGAIDKGKKEIIVNIEGGVPVKMGESLYVRSGESIIIMEATFPMQTSVKCRLKKKYSGQLKSVTKGMMVYKYEEGVETADEAGVNNSLLGTWKYTVSSPDARGGESGTITFNKNGTYVDVMDPPMDNPGAGKSTNKGRYRVEPENGILEYIGKESNTKYYLKEKTGESLVFETFNQEYGMRFIYTIYCNNTAPFTISTRPLTEPEPQ